MKKFVYLASLALAMVAFVACNTNQPENKTQKGVDVIDKSYAEAFYGYAEISVPAGVTTVYVENYGGLDEQGNKINLKVTPLQVTPIIEEPKNGKNVEPFGKVKLMFKAPIETMVAVYYVAGEGAANYSLENHAPKARGMYEEGDEEENTTEIFVLNDLPLDHALIGQFGKCRYVTTPWEYGWENNGGGNIQKFPKDVVIYDEEHNHTLRYKFAYAGSIVAHDGYFLEEGYEVENYTVKAIKTNFCPSCGVGCPNCMPWGCSCSCGYVNTSFVGNGNTTTSADSGTPAQVPADVVTVNLQEPAPYVTHADVEHTQTFYHSSGVVMFEDSWPTVNQGGTYDTDFDDCVIDYDIEAKTVADELLPTEGYREEVKVVLHLRAVGSDLTNGPYRVGLRLEGFDTENVEYIEQFFTLDSWQNPHGELPVFTESTIQRNSGHYETDKQNPIVEMAHIFTMGQERAGKGENAIYTYTNNGHSHETVFNLTYGQYPDKYPDASQYDPSLPTDPNLPYQWSNLMNQKFYNCIPGYINVAGGLVTQTVIYHMKPRANMEPAERDAVKANMIAAVTNTTNQNFYIIKKDFTPIGLKGYEPVLLHNESNNPYNTKYNAGVANGTLDASIPYYGTNGTVWGFKCPTLTRHIWNKMYFSQSYPHYEEWVNSNGAEHKQWYYEDVNEKYLVCWW